MTATVINALVFFNELNNHGIPAIVLSAYKVGTLTEAYSSIKAKQYLAEGKVVIFAGGTGLPFFTTDTAVMLRAVEIDFDIIAIAKNDTDGIYDKDPNLHHDAVKLHKINHHDLLSKELKVFDLTATAMCKEHQLSVIVFNLNEPDSILKVMGGEIKGTIIS